ncbi:unnamed protein product [Rhizophagus irregularis]|uniref:Uncharacterized protein n=1 Tax=Rhizophagus irregularis TaxID=588596 RepID=A0A2N1P414_9GLOM|nr:hypothetical protein RhiirC2_841371 [Rhizophagus irregularis]CAB4386048.1 unnamed protein product [Rhizophagus irregularis]CAB5374086.1 unnamed protein product [Rhizophagus irregularis]
MSENLQILLHTKDPSKRKHVLILETKIHTFILIKISSPLEIIERSNKRNYKSPLKNAYMLFMIDCSDALKIPKKTEKKVRHPECFKDFPNLWSLSPKEVKDEYEQVFKSYRNLNKNNTLHFINCNPNGQTSNSTSQPAITEQLQHRSIDVSSLAKNQSSSVQPESVTSIGSTENSTNSFVQWEDTPALDNFLARYLSYPDDDLI